MDSRRVAKAPGRRAELFPPHASNASCVIAVTGNQIVRSGEFKPSLIQPTGVCHGRSRSWERKNPLQIFAAYLFPSSSGSQSLAANQALEKSKTRDELLKQAIEVVFLDKKDKMAGDAPSFESRRAHRSHWLEIYNSLSDVKLSNEFIAITMEQDTVADEKNFYWTGNLPSLIPNTETRAANSTDEDEWATVGSQSGAWIPSVIPI